MRIIITFTALLLSIVFLQLSTGAIAPLDAISGLEANFSRIHLGLMGSAHFIGFFIGCWWTPRLIGNIGYSRTFAFFASLGIIGIIGHPLFINANFWIGLRILSGMCIAGCYTIIEAWFQAKITNNNRGRILGAYRVIDIGASALAQMMISFLEPMSYISYNLLAILACVTLWPITLSQSKAPTIPNAPRLHPIRTAITSPVGVAGVIVAGITTASFRMIGPIYGADRGLEPSQIGIFLALVLVGGALIQLPIGYFADKFERRRILIILSIASIGVCVAFILFEELNIYRIYSFAFCFGMTTFPIFSISAAHANDFASPEQRIELNASLMFCYAIGAVCSPLITSTLMQLFGSSAMFIFISIVHLFLVFFNINRIRIRPPLKNRTKYHYMPRTSFLIGKLLRRRNLD